VATVGKPMPAASGDQIQRFERKLREVKLALAALPGERYHEELLQTVRRAGWTTQAEGIFFDSLTDQMLTHIRDLQMLHQRLKAAFEAVQGE
jgi:hypothetical protein